MRRPVLHRPCGADGFTLIEVMVAVTLLCGGLLATLGVLNSSQRASLGTVRAQSAYESAESVLEKAAALGMSNWSGLAMSGKPASSASAANPNWYLAPASCTTGTCTSLQIDQTPNDGSVSAPTGAATISSAEPLVVATGSCTTWVTCVPLTTPVTGGTASIYVTTASDQTLTVASTTYQPKRITVAVTLAATGSSHTVTEPTWVSTVVSPQVTAQ